MFDHSIYVRNIKINKTLPQARTDALIFCKNCRIDPTDGVQSAHQHRATALFGTATANVTGPKLIAQRLITDQSIVKRQLFTTKYRSAGLDENAALHVISHTIRSA